MNVTVENVSPEPRIWTADDGRKVYYVTAYFSNGTKGSVGVSEAEYQPHYESLKALIGQNVNLDLQSPKEYNGVTEYKIKGTWPGRPASQRRGGGGGGMSDKQAALIAAASLGGSGQNSPADAAAAAEWFLAHYFSGGGAPGQVDAALPRSESSSLPRGTSPPATLAQITALRTLAQRNGFGLDDYTQLSQDEASELIKLWQVPVSSTT